MVLSWLGLVLAQGLTGRMQTRHAYWGTEWGQHLHAALGAVRVSFVGVDAVST